MHHLHQNSELSSEAHGPKLVDAHGLLEALFAEESRPSLRWIRQMQAQRKISYTKIGHLVRFDIEQVRKDLAENCTVNPRKR